MRVELYTDGAAINNGKAGSIGFSAVLLMPKSELLQFSGSETGEPVSSNRAELLGMELGLEQLRKGGWRPEHLLVFSDSEWAVKAVNGEYRTSSNQELIAAIRSALRCFPRTEVNWLRGHCGHVLNERAHQLANAAVRKAEEERCQQRPKRGPLTLKLSSGNCTLGARKPKESGSNGSSRTAPTKSLSQTRLDRISSPPHTYFRAWTQWTVKLYDQTEWPTAALLERLEEIGPEVARLKKLTTPLKTDLSAEEWTMAHDRLLFLEGQYQAIQEALARRQRRNPQSVSATSSPGSKRSTSTPARVSAASRDPFAEE